MTSMCLRRFKYHIDGIVFKLHFYEYKYCLSQFTRRERMWQMYFQDISRI